MSQPGRAPSYEAPPLMPAVDAAPPLLTRFGALAGETFPSDEVAAAFKAFLVAAGGNPAAFGARPPADDLAEAGSRYARTTCRSWPRAGSSRGPGSGASTAGPSGSRTAQPPRAMR